MRSFVSDRKLLVPESLNRSAFVPVAAMLTVCTGLDWAAVVGLSSMMEAVVLLEVVARSRTAMLPAVKFAGTVRSSNFSTFRRVRLVFERRLPWLAAPVSRRFPGATGGKRYFFMAA